MSQQLVKECLYRRPAATSHLQRACCGFNCWAAVQAGESTIAKEKAATNSSMNQVQHYGEAFAKIQDATGERGRHVLFCWRLQVYQMEGTALP